jgi:hypothetical protein
MLIVVVALTDIYSATAEAAIIEVLNMAGWLMTFSILALGSTAISTKTKSRGINCPQPGATDVG